jgi:DNA-binding CsgD family transcriptional regulator
MGNYFERIIELRKENKTYKEICEILGCAMSTVSYHCKMNNLGGHSDRLTDERKKELQVLYDELGSIKKVSQKTGHSHETVLKYVKTNKKIRKTTKSENVIIWRVRVKQKLVDYKGGCCETCGYNKSLRALHFHHKDPSQKDFSISGKSLSFERMKNEVDKCILVCSNCHSEIHDGILKITSGG